MEFVPVFFCGGLTCIDYCNTYDHAHTPPAYDFFSDFSAVLEWGKAAGILPAGTQATGPADLSILEKAKQVRPLIYRLLEPFTRLQQPAEADLAEFNDLFREVSSWTEIASGQEGFTLSCCSDDPLKKILCEVVRSTADLLVANQSERVKQCEECSWLFYDSTRNLSRRWCDMKTCGNKAKARRHYERVRQNRLGAAG
ncbi:MAG TPA: CGNR zinc finger domain-containing protein [Anaerolineales bacterium]|nr:CGNR zinc finger domain-containing protein [Anaerolineales bacterium]